MRYLSLGLLLLLANIVIADGPPSAAVGPQDPQNATWHIGLDGLWGSTSKQQLRSLDVYQVFQAGKPVNAIASARLYNSSMHFVHATSVAFDPAGKRLSGSMHVRITPDPWVPADGLPYDLVVDVAGHLVADAGHDRLEGSYSARREDGKPLHDEAKTVEGKLTGGPDDPGAAELPPLLRRQPPQRPAAG